MTEDYERLMQLRREAGIDDADGNPKRIARYGSSSPTPTTPATAKAAPARPVARARVFKAEAFFALHDQGQLALAGVG